MSVIYQRVHMDGGIETVFGSGTGTPETFEIADFSLTPNITRIERNVHRYSMSPPPVRNGQVTQQFTFNMEVRGAGVTDGSRPPNVGKMLRACGFAQTQFTAPAMAKAWGNPSNTRLAAVALTAASGGSAFTGLVPRLVSVTMTSATQATVLAHETPNGHPEVATTGVAITSGTPIAGPQGASMIMTYTGALVAGDSYYFWFVPRGYLYTPIGDPESMESIYLRATLGNKRHIMRGSYGTVSMTATAGEIATFGFQMSGDWQNPLDFVMPANPDTSTFGALPPIVELADLSLNNRLVSCPTTFGFDMANTINNILCANALAGNNGAQLSARQPTASFNMDSVPVASMDIWSMLSTGSRLLMHAYIGSQPGNIMHMIANGQLTNTQYAELNTLRKNDNTMNLSGAQGNDELMLFFA